MESELRVSAQPELTRPVLVAAFRGWNDGAQAASLAARSSLDAPKHASTSCRDLIACADATRTSAVRVEEV